MVNELFIMQGAPGCGKSTFINENQLNDYVISPDSIRELINQVNQIITGTTIIKNDSPQNEINNDYIIVNDDDYNNGYDFSPRTSKLAFEITDEILQQRLRRGQTVILDLTAASRKTIGKLLQTANVYNYHVNYVNMQKNLTVNEILKRNRNRGIRAVPDVVVRKMYDAVSNYKYEKHEHVITTADMLNKQYVSIDTGIQNKYDRAVFIGDIQGVYDRFSKTELMHPHDDTAYIFTGDILDRGNGAAEMFDWVIDHIDNDNIIVIRGNHDNYWRYYCNPAIESRYYGKATQNSIEDILKRSKYAGGNPKTLHKLAKTTEKKFTDMFAFQVNDKVYVATHGGLLPNELVNNYDADKHAYKLGFKSEQYFYYGAGTTIDTGDYKTDIDRIIESYYLAYNNASNAPDMIQIHGHRNEYKHAVNEFTHTVNLEQHVEYPDGNLALAVLDFRTNELSYQLIH